MLSVVKCNQYLVQTSFYAVYFFQVFFFFSFLVISAKKASYEIVGHEFQELHTPVQNWNMSGGREKGWKCRIWEVSLRPKGQHCYGDTERLGRACEVGCCRVGGTGRGCRDWATFLKWVRETGVSEGEIWNQDLLMQETHMGPEKKKVIRTKLC